MMTDNYLFSKTHCWLYSQGGVATVGISDYAQQELGDVVYVDLPALGKRFEVEGVCATIESVKTASDVYCPATGVVQAINESLQTNPEHINTSPYDRGWLFKIALEDGKEPEGLLSAAAYMQEFGIAPD